MSAAGGDKAQQSKQWVKKGERQRRGGYGEERGREKGERAEGIREEKEKKGRGDN